ncbi:MAG: hypothetical protein LBV31_01485 [Prevotellaceae bacterium]|jgi:hypothetical protein|nr:hypothetical protein [Prevotellaceae bacterium]
MIKLKYLSLIFGLLLVSNIAAQLPVGGWRMHLAYSNTTKVEATPNRVFAVSDGALYSVGKEDFDVATYDKVSGLSDANISNIKYDAATEQLIIVYANGNIDLLGARGIVNVPDLYIRQMSASKTVNHIFCNAKKAYLATDFGILVLDLNKAEIKDTYYIGKESSTVKVLATTVFDGKIFAVSEDSVYSATLTANLVDYQYWATGEDLPGTAAFQSVATFANKFFVLRGGEVFFTDNAFAASSSWTKLDMEAGAQSIKQSDNYLFVTWTYLAAHYDNAMNRTYTRLGNFYTISDYVFANNRDWFAAIAKGLATQPANTEDATYFQPNGPAVNAAWDMTFAGEKLFVVSGGHAGDNFLNPGNVSIFANNQWKNITHSEIQEQTQKPLFDFLNTAIDPDDDSHFFVTSYGTGLYEFRDDKFYKRHNQDNTGGIIQTYPGMNPDSYTRLKGAVFDKEGNLWFENAGVAASIKILSKDGVWAQLQYPNALFERLGQVAVNALYPNQKWALSMYGSVLVFDDNGTVLDPRDDKSKVFYGFNYIKNQELANTNTVLAYNCFAQDKNGVIWIGTDKGPLLFNNTNNIFSADYLCSKVLIPRNDGTGFGDFLLDEEPVKAIAIDGANRKWIGTGNSGVYLVSASGLETIHHFTAENSPLPHNNVQSIAINNVTGEVFFGTPTGIASYQSDAAEPQATFEKGNIRAYPNPVRPPYEGVITITGLMENSIVKITDVAGNLMYQTTSNGSLATWNGHNSVGNKVNSGVYVVMCVAPDGSLYGTTKVLIFK